LRAGRRRRLADPGPDPPFPPGARAPDYRTTGGSAGGCRMKKLLLSVLGAVTIVTAMPLPASAQDSAPQENPMQARRRALARGEQASQAASTRTDLIRAVG